MMGSISSEQPNKYTTSSWFWMTMLVLLKIYFPDVEETSFIFIF